MGREKKNAPGSTGGSHAKDRHNRIRRTAVSAAQRSEHPPPGLVARRDRPKPSDNYKSYFEFVENKDKKKKLEIQLTSDINPPPGFVFVPSGNPMLTHECKEISREKEAMIFVVTSAPTQRTKELIQHMHRVGYHIREAIAVEARKCLGIASEASSAVPPGAPEPLPEDQAEIYAQADAALRDLFPRIPNTDRQEILETSFNKENRKTKVSVGLASDLPLARRVQLAVLAHIRHRHTRYDQLLSETTRDNARKIVQTLCLDYLVKWRGDEENGRDQMDEILREVIIISDSDDSDDDFDGDEDDGAESCRNSGRSITSAEAQERPQMQILHAANPHLSRGVGLAKATVSAAKVPKCAGGARKAARNPHRGFQRYQAVYDQAWREALERQRKLETNTQRIVDLSTPEPLDRSKVLSQSSVAVMRVSQGLAQPGHARHRSSGLLSSRAELHYDDIRDDLIREPRPHAMDRSGPASFPGERHDRQFPSVTQGTRLDEQRRAGQNSAFRGSERASWTGPDTCQYEIANDHTQFGEPGSPPRVHSVNEPALHGYDPNSHRGRSIQPDVLYYPSKQKPSQLSAYYEKQDPREPKDRPAGLPPGYHSAPLVPRPEHPVPVSQPRDEGALPAFIDLSRAPEHRYVRLNPEGRVGWEDVRLRTASKPIFINDDEPVSFRPKPRPLLVGNSNSLPEQPAPRESQLYRQRAMLGSHAYQTPELQPPNPVVGGSSAPHQNDLTSRSASENLHQPNQIVPVSNKFPPRYEFPPSPERRGVRSGLESHPRTERVVTMVEKPIRQTAFDAFAARSYETDGPSQARHERVIGYEFGVGPYDRQRVHVAHTPVQRFPRGDSVIPVFSSSARDQGADRLLSHVYHEEETIFPSRELPDLPNYRTPPYARN